MERGPGVAEPPQPSGPGRWRWTLLALVVFVAADAALFRVFRGHDLRDGTLLPPLSVYEQMAQGEPEPQPLERWHGLAMNDLRFVVWLVARNARTLLTRPWALFDAEQCFPAPSSLALGEPGIAQGVVAAPGYWITRDPLATYDLLLFALPLIAGLAMFLLVRDWTGVPAAGIAAGLLYGFHPIKTWEVVHPYVWDTAWTVLALWLTVRLFARPRWRDALALGACVALQVAGSFYALLSAMGIGAPFLGWLAWRNGVSRALLLRLGLAAGLALLAAAWVMGPYLELRSSGVLEVRTEQHFVMADWLLPGGFLFVGWTLAALALLGLAFRDGLDPRLRGSPRWVLAGSCLGLFVLSAGGGVDPELGRPAPLFGVWGWLAGIVPGLDVIRSPGSLYAGVHLALCILAGLGGALLLRAVRGRLRGGASAALVALAAAAVLLPHGLLGDAADDYRFVSLRPDPASLELFTTLDRLGNRGPILAVPVPPHSRVPRVTGSLLLSAYHGRPTSECYNSFAPPELERARRVADSLPSVEGAHAARRLGFTTVLLHHGPDQPFGKARRRTFERFVDAHPGGPLVRLHGNDAATAYALVPEAEPAWSETRLAPRVSIADRQGGVERRGDDLLLAGGARAAFYLPHSPGSRLRARLEGHGELEVVAESGESLRVRRPAEDVDLDLSPLEGDLLRIVVGAGKGGARWSDLRIVRPGPVAPRLDVPRARYDVLVVLFDSLRADELDLEGGPAGATPALAALADGGVRFDAARSPASWTRPSVASLLTSLAPATHGISLLVEGLPEGVPYLPELLSDAGYLTAAVTFSSQITSDLGFERGFERFERFYAPDTYARLQALATPEERADAVWREALAPVLRGAGEKPWFAYLHELDPHYPYEPPPPYDAGLGEAAGATEQATTPDPYMREGFDAADLARLRGLYRGEVRFMDDFLAALLRRVRDAQGGRPTLVVFLSDHGEAFGERGQLGHALVVHETQLRIPLLMHLDGVLPAGVRVDEPVDLVDVAPTLLDLVDLERPPAMQGRSLLPLVARAARPGPPRPFVAEALAGLQTSLRLGRWKLVRDAWPASGLSISRSGAPWLSIGQIVALEDLDPRATPHEDALFDLSTDPGEERDLAPDRPFVASALRQLLAWEEHRLASLAPAAPVRPALGAEERDQLRQLGYLE